MKKYLYVICLVAAFGGMISCSKNNDPAPDPVVVGKWMSDYVVPSGFVAPYASNNGLHLNPALFGVTDGYDIKSDKTFIYTNRYSAVIQTLSGTWDYADPTLSLKYDNGFMETLTYSAPTSTSAGASAQLSFQEARADTLTNPTTKVDELVKYNLQYVYTKQ